MIKITSTFAIRTIIIIGVMILLVGIIQVSAATTVTMASYTGVNDTQANTRDIYWRGQSFTSTQNAIVNNISLSFASGGTSGNLIVGIRSLNATGMPTGNDICNGTIATSSLTTDTYRNISMTYGNCNINTGQTYVIIFRQPSTANTLSIDLQNTGGYSGGTAFGSSNSGVGDWSTSSSDYVFYVYGILGTGTLTTTLYYPENNSNWFNSSIPFSANFTAAVNSTLTVWNSDSTLFGTNYTTIDVTTNSTTNYLSRFLPDNSYSWNYYSCNSTGSCAYATSNYTFITNNMVFGTCNSTLTIPYLNISFKDEVSNNYINGSLTNILFSYAYNQNFGWRSYLYSNLSTSIASYPFCYIPSDKGVYVNYSVQYNYPGYASRSLLSGIITTTNTTTNKILYLLDSSSGQYVTFQVVGAAEQPLQNVYVTATKGGNLISSGYTGADGGVTFWLDYTTIHTFVFSLTGYSDQTLSIVPAQSSYTVSMGGSSTNTTSYDYNRGINYVIAPSGISMFNSTNYTFSFNLTSVYWNVDKFGFRLTNSTALLGTKELSTNGGSAAIGFNTRNESILYMNYYWVINSTYTNGTITFIILNSGGTGWSLSTFFTDLQTYITSGMWGLTSSFGIPLITFMFIFIFTGVMSYKFGFTSPAAIMALVFALVAFFDIGLGLIPNVNNIHFVTIFVGLILGGILLREATQ